MTTASATTPAILWSATWLSHTWRLSAMPNGQYRTTASRINQLGHVQLETVVSPTVSEGWSNLASRWLTATEPIYDAAERRFRIDLIAYVHGRPGFRSGSPALRQRAEQARDDLFAMARSCGRDWLRLRDAAGATVASLAIPDWLSNALDDLAQPGNATVPPLEHWMRRQA